MATTPTTSLSSPGLLKSIARDVFSRYVTSIPVKIALRCVTIGHNLVYQSGLRVSFTHSCLWFYHSVLSAFSLTTFLPISLFPFRAYGLQGKKKEDHAALGKSIVPQFFSSFFLSFVLSCC